MNYFEKHIGDYLKDTAHLSLLEHGVYNRLLDVYYTTERPLPTDPAAVQRLLNARGKEEKKAVTDVLTEFFSLDDDGWHQRRCDADILKFQQKSDKAKKSANTRWAKEKGEVTANEQHANAYANASVDEHANAYPVAMRSHSEGNAPRARPQSPDTRHHIPPTPKGARFAEFWEVWPISPRKVAKADCEKRWKAKGLDAEADRIIAHVEAMKGTDQWQRGYEPSPSTYLNQRRWEDDDASSDLLSRGHANSV